MSDRNGKIFCTSIASLSHISKTARRKTNQARRLYQAVCLGLPALSSETRTETLREIGRFFHRYDPFFLAHALPCSIDYPLCLPVPESYQGVEYLLEYLRRLAMEHRFLRRFDPASSAALLNRCRPGSRELPLNLCEPVLMQALGRALLALDPARLELTTRQQEQLLLRLAPLSSDALHTAVQQAFAALSKALLLSPSAAAYLQQAALEWTPTIRAAAAGGSVAGVFCRLP